MALGDVVEREFASYQGGAIKYFAEFKEVGSHTEPAGNRAGEIDTIEEEVQNVRIERTAAAKGRVRARLKFAGRNIDVTSNDTGKARSDARRVSAGERVTHGPPLNIEVSTE